MTLRELALLLVALSLVSCSTGIKLRSQVEMEVDDYGCTSGVCAVTIDWEATRSKEWDWSEGCFGEIEFYWPGDKAGEPDHGPLGLAPERVVRTLEEWHESVSGSFELTMSPTNELSAEATHYLVIDADLCAERDGTLGLYLLFSEAGTPLVSLEVLDGPQG